MIAAIVPDICTHLGADFLSGAILLGGLPFMSPEGFSVVSPQTFSTIFPAIYSTETTVHKNTILEFGKALFLDPESIPFDVRCAWMGVTFFMTAPLFQLVLSRPQSVKEFEEAGKEGKLKVLCINADKDEQRNGGVPVAEVLRRSFPDVEEVVIKDAGHAFFYEKPEETNKLLLEFVRKVQTS
jgi:pimeloyl-ACP methyl ester carboxylesterase